MVSLYIRLEMVRFTSQVLYYDVKELYATLYGAYMWSWLNPSPPFIDIFACTLC